jgi:putative ABC transport system permease protein
MTLFRFASREILRAKFRFGLIALILTLQVAALGGGHLAQASLFRTRDVWSERLRLADLEVRVVPASRDEFQPAFEALQRLPGVMAVSRRFLTLGYMERPDASAKTPGNGMPAAALPVVIHYVEPDVHPPVNDIALLEGSWLSQGAPEGALVDRSFAEAHGLRIGDEIVINPHRFASRFTVKGIGLSAEYLVPTANPELLVPHKGSLGILYASRQALDRTFPDELYNDVVLSFARDADSKATTERILSVLEPLGIERVVTKKASFGYRFLDVILSGSRAVAPILALIVALMASIVSVLSMHRLIRERRPELGSLLALGYSPAQLSVTFFAMGLVPGIVGGLAGIVAAMAFGAMVAIKTASISGLPTPIMAWEPPALTLAGGSAVLVGLLASFPPALEVLRMRPNEALRAAGGISFEGLPRPLEALVETLADRMPSTSVRYGLRNVFRKLSLSMATSLLIALAVALPAGLLTTVSSWETWAKIEAARLSWDAIASFKVPMTVEHVKDVMADKGIATWEGYVQGYAPVTRADGSTEEMRVRGLPTTGTLVPIPVVEGRSFSSETANEAILNSAFSRGNPPKTGERIMLTRHGVTTELRVVGILTSAALSTVLVPRGTASRIFELEGKVSGAYVRYGIAPSPAISRNAEAPPSDAPSNAEILEKIDLDEATAQSLPAPPPPPKNDVREPRTALLGEELVTNVEVRTEYADATLKYLASFHVIVLPFIGLSGILAFAFLLSVLGFLLLERETEYATLRSMGFTTKDIAVIVLTEVGILGALGLFVALVAWVSTAYALRAPMASAWFEVPLDFRPRDFLAAALPTLAFLMVATIPGVRALMKLDLAKALRGRAIG